MGSKTRKTTQTHCDKPTCNPAIIKTASLKSAVYVLVAFNVLLVLVLSVFTGLHHRKLQSHATCWQQTDGDGGMEDEHTTYCFRAEKKQCLERGYVSKERGSESVCCGNLNEHIYSLMSEVIPEKLRTDAARASMLDNVKRHIVRLQKDPKAVQFRHAAHVGILPNGNTTGPDSEVPRIHWEQSGERSFLSAGVIHGGDRLTITKAGYYYVYTGLQFDVDTQAAESGATASYIYRHVNGTKESRRKLMMTRESSCRWTRNGTSGPVSTHMAGIFLLRQGDEISVRTSAQSLLHRSSATTYMGLHMV